ncbi:uncharacterized protein LOC114541163 [Dendronephthya gigantea]|uniref:uncharacterized protein LOC114541163 n=1 Tax=Dendronephthya gigantea TaxID=151771 RepID=UPI0010692D43|nr:uncharacterized protein LOC114541163 [Dendronephthya gigantea]
MFCKGIKLAFLIVMGLIVLTGAEIEIELTQLEPARRIHVFKGDVVKLKCVSSDSKGNPISVSWHYQNSNTPAITNSTNNTDIDTWKKDNKTISIFTHRVYERPNKLWYIYCKAKSKSDSKNKNRALKYVPDKDIPRITVSIPQTQAVVNGTHRHVLRCNVSSNVKITKLSIKWLFDGKALSEKSIEEVKYGEHYLLLQCLTKKDLGNYTCVANTTEYSLDWSDSSVTLLTGEFTVSGGLKNSAWRSLYLVAFVLTSLWWRTFL